MIGVKDITIISLDNEEFGWEIFERSKQKIYQNIKLIEYNKGDKGKSHAQVSRRDVSK
jgi:hypothetical protein